jgi:hypothetical protein
MLNDIKAYRLEFSGYGKPRYGSLEVVQFCECLKSDVALFQAFGYFSGVFQMLRIVTRWFFVPKECLLVKYEREVAN